VLRRPCGQQQRLDALGFLPVVVANSFAAEIFACGHRFRQAYKSIGHEKFPSRVSSAGG